MAEVTKSEMDGRDDAGILLGLRPQTGDDRKKDHTAVSRDMSVNEDDIDDRDNSEKSNGNSISEYTQTRNLNLGQERAAAGRRAAERKRLEDIKRKEEEERMRNFLKQKELEKQKELDRLAAYKRQKELKKIADRQAYLDYMDKLEREKLSLFEKRKEYSELRAQLALAKDNNNTKQNQMNYAILQRRLKEQEEAIRLQ